MDKVELYDLIAQKVNYIKSISSLVCAADNADGAADIDAVALCADLAEEVKQLAKQMIRAKH